MEITVQGVGMKINDELDKLTRTKLSKYSRYFDGKGEVLAKYTAEHNEVTCEITFHIGKQFYRSESRNVDARTALDSSLERLGGQLRRHKTRFRDHKNQTPYLDAMLQASEDLQEELPGDAESDAEEFFESRGEIVRHKQFDLLPMSDEEAVLQMEMLGHSFFIYISDETEQVCVVYRRHDGDYGVLEPNY